MSELLEKVSDFVVQTLAKEEWKRLNGRDYERCAVDVPHDVGNQIGFEIHKLVKSEVTGLVDHFHEDVIRLAEFFLRLTGAERWPKTNPGDDIQHDQREIEWRMAKAWHVATPSERFLANLLVMVWRHEMALAGVVEKI